MENQKINFGKFRGLTFEDVYQISHYCEWVRTLQETKGKMTQLQNYIFAMDQFNEEMKEYRN